MLKRYEETSLPVFREREINEAAEKPLKQELPETLTDQKLLDGDPAVVFMAYSVAVSWSLFLLPLVVGLTVAWANNLAVLSIEMFSFSIILVSNFNTRSQKVRRMKPYLTREELFWPWIGRAAFALYLITAITLLIGAFPSIVPASVRGSNWFWLCLTNGQVGMFLLKTSCLACLILGTYTVNKDMFIFFKSASAERMQRCWLRDFFEKEYASLEREVHRAISHLPADSQKTDPIWKEWIDGPRVVSNHDTFKEAGSEPARLLWKRLVSTRGRVPIWMLDVPSIARWASDLKVEAEERRTGRD